MKTRILKLAAAILAMMPLLAACGGGGGSDGGGTAPPPTGGITRTGDAVAVGPITGFASVIVNGVEYHTDAATTFIHDDNPSASQADFEVGETVLITGTIDDNGNARATEVEFEDAVEGPATNVDDLAGTFVVLGQTVRVVPTTSFDDSCNIDSLTELSGFAQVEVSGSADDLGVIEATRIECKTTVGANDLWEVKGIATNPGATTFEINGFVVDYSGVTPSNFPGDVISEGDPVEAKGSTLTGAGALLATSVEYKGDRFAGDDDVGDHMEIEGFITDFTSPTDFYVSGIPVTEITGTTVYEGGSRTDLRAGRKVEVEGEFDTQGVLNATKIEIKSATAIRVVAALDAVEGNLLTILGIPIHTDNLETRFEDKTDADASPLLVGVGDYLEVRGQELPANEITAVIVERDDKEARIELRGFVDGLDTINRTLQVLTVTIRTSLETEYRNEGDLPMRADAFWAAVAERRRLVSVREDRRGDSDPQYQDFPLPGITTIDATELQLERE